MKQPFNQILFDTDSAVERNSESVRTASGWWLLPCAALGSIGWVGVFSLFFW